MFTGLRTLALTLLICCNSAGAADNLGADDSPVINVLVDVSGSMRQNDPANHRIDALKLLINLLPDGTRAGIWMFAEDTQSLVHTQSVRAVWKKKALSSINKVHSRGLYTHIEDALQTALDDFAAPAQSKHLVLLTDGMVDISENIMQSAESRERIISELIPLFQQQQVKIHTIALSDAADRELLDKLAFDTGGWAEAPESADQLQKTFLTLFNKSVPQDTLPLTGNSFQVDPSVKEFSLLIFKRPTSKPTQLISPENDVLNASTQTEKVSWVVEQTYDLISVREPVSGTWKIEAELDTGSQVMIVTDLKLHLNELPATLAEGEPLRLQLYFTDQDKRIDRQDFLQLVKLSLQQVDQLQRKSDWILPPDGDGTGRFTHTLKNTLDEGRHTLTFIADGKTFQRQLTKTVDVVKADIQAHTQIDREHGQVNIELVPNQDVIDISKLKLQASVSHADQPATSVDIIPTDERFLLSLPLPKSGDKIVVNFSAMAQSYQGASISPNIKPVIIDAKFMEAQADQTRVANVEPPDSEAQPAPAETATTSIEDATDEVETPTESPDEETNEPAKKGHWGIVAGIVAVINLLLFATGFFLFRWMKKRTAQKHEQLLERLI